jgi:hypothetical protein
VAMASSPDARCLESFPMCFFVFFPHF